MKILVCLVLLTVAVGVNASPFLTCNPQSGVTKYAFTGPAWVPLTYPAQADGRLFMDISTSYIGQNSITVKACRDDPVWGELCSDAVPFVFTRPGVADTPSGFRLIP